LNQLLVSPSSDAERQFGKVERHELELTILMPCLNEADTIATCIDKATGFLRCSDIRGEILVVDNGSSDASADIAAAHGARVCHATVRGYGAALRSGIENARGEFVIMGDADGSYNFSKLDPFVRELRAGYDLVMGNRFQGGISPGAMPPLHRYLGNPILSFLGRLFFSSQVRDFHCGLRGFRRDAILGLHLKSTGMEFASEMVVRSSIAGLRITEVPTTLSPDGRSRPPHLRTWHDGWRHLRFLLLYSPRWLFLYPSAVISTIGLLLSFVLLRGPVSILPGVVMDIHSLIVACTAVLIGAQVFSFGIIARRYAAARGLLPASVQLRRLKGIVTLERLLILSAVVLVLGLAGLIHSVATWAAANFGPLQYGTMIRTLLASCSLIALALQVGFTAFLFALFDIDA
jgi:glycosyltransferase involved in cell wall biosynthesis